MLLRRLVTLSVLALCSFQALSAMYRYVDEQGRTIYSQHPPASGNAELIKPPPPPPTQPEVKTGDAVPPAGPAGKPETPVAGDGDKAARRVESERIKADNCARARKMLEMYNNPQNRLVKTPEGLYERVTDEKRAQGIEAANKTIQEFCN
jgi:hypothetical protein